jgi:cysteine desulfurase
VSRAYLDHASCVPLRPEGRAALVDALDRFGTDPGRLHSEGMASRAALEHARDQVAALVGARSREVVFTSGASEAIAAACWGAARAHDGPQVISPVEHSAVRLCAARHGEVVEMRVDGVGRVDLDDLDRALDAGPSLVHLQWANHEVGTRQPVADVVARCRARKVLVHVDAAQGVGRDDIAFDELGADLLSLSGPKFGAPMGTGALLVRRGVRLEPLLVGGDQERARRAGLENVPALVGMGAVAEVLAEPTTRADEAARDAARIDELAAALTGPDGIDGVTRLGDPVDRVPHLLCLAVADVEPQAVLLGLDQQGVSAHSGSSCSTESLEPSPVLEAMGVDAQRSLRLSVGWSTVEEDLERTVTAIHRVVEDLRRLRG